MNLTTTPLKETAAMKKVIVSALAALVVLVGSSNRPAQAQFAVIDPANLIENIISALQNVQAVANQVTQLSHEVQSLANQAQNLQNLPASISGQVLGQYVQQYGQLVQAVGAIQGIAHDVATLTQQYDTMFPNTPLAAGSLNYQTVMGQLTGWLGQTRSVYQGAYRTQAQVMQSLGADSATIQALLTQSGASHGALDATQAGNQLMGQVASQLLKMNQQMATMNQAQLTWIAEQTQLSAQAQKHQVDAMAGYGAASTAPVNPNLDRMH